MGTGGSRTVGENGKVVGVDYNPACLDGANLIVGDITEPFTQQAVLDAIDTEVIDVVVSDISPHITGNGTLIKLYL